MAQNRPEVGDTDCTAKLRLAFEPTRGQRDFSRIAKLGLEPTGSRRYCYRTVKLGLAFEPTRDRQYAVYRQACLVHNRLEVSDTE